MLDGSKQQSLNRQNQDKSFSNNVNNSSQKGESKKSPSKESLITNFLTSVKSFKSEKPKHNPLLIDEDIQQEEKIQAFGTENQDRTSNNVNLKNPANQVAKQSMQRQQANHSVLSLPASLKQQALDMIIHEDNKIQQLFEEIKPEISVKIVSSVLKGNTLSKYFVYTIKGQDAHGPFYVSRKYSEFQALRKILTRRWPGSFIPGLKNKFDMKNQQQRQILIEQILINFLVSLSYSKHIYYKEEVQLFLRSPDVDISEMFEQMPQLKTSDLVSRFEYSFGQQLQEIQGPKITQIIAKFHKKLRKLIAKLQEITNYALNLAQSYDTYTKSLMKFSQTMKYYEHFSLAQFTQNIRQMTIFVKDDDKKVDQMKNVLKLNAFYVLVRLFQIQLIDARSFLQIIIGIDLYSLRKEQLQKQLIQCMSQKQQLQEGNMTIKTMTTRKHKQEVVKILDEKVKSLQQQKQNTIRLYNIVEKVTAKHIIPTFKFIKKNNYCRALAKWIQLVGKQIPEMQTIWKFVNNETTETKNKVVSNDC